MRYSYDRYGDEDAKLIRIYKEDKQFAPENGRELKFRPGDVVDFMSVNGKRTRCAVTGYYSHEKSDELYARGFRYLLDWDLPWMPVQECRLSLVERPAGKLRWMRNVHLKLFKEFYACNKLELFVAKKPVLVTKEYGEDIWMCHGTVWKGPMMELSGDETCDVCRDCPCTWDSWKTTVGSNFYGKTCMRSTVGVVKKYFKEEEILRYSGEDDNYLWDLMESLIFSAL